MFDFEINNCLRSCESFAGVYARDRIPKIMFYPSFYIINSDKSSERGSHWVAMRFTETTCEYFDSFGLPPMYSEMIKAVGKRKLLWNGRCIQHPNSYTCGEFCISFVKLRSKNISFIRFIKMFRSDTKSNDKIARSIILSA